MSTKEFTFNSSLCTPSTCLFIKHLLTTNLSAVIQWVISPLSLGSRGNLDWSSWMMYSFLQAVQQQICISRQLTPTGQGIINCIFCVEIFIDLSRSQEWDFSTFSYPWHTECLSMCYQQQIPRRVQLHLLFRTQLTHLHKCHLTILNS